MYRMEQQTYIYLLQRYLETIYPSKCEARTRLLRLMSKLEELHALTTENRRYHTENPRYHSELNPNDAPLLVEIYGLNQ